MIYELDYRYSSGVMRESKLHHMWESSSDLQAVREAIAYVKELIGKAEGFFPDVLVLTIMQVEIRDIDSGLCLVKRVYEWKIPHGLIGCPDGMTLEEADPRPGKGGGA